MVAARYLEAPIASDEQVTQDKNMKGEVLPHLKVIMVSMNCYRTTR